MGAAGAGHLVAGQRTRPCPRPSGRPCRRATSRTTRCSTSPCSASPPDGRLRVQIEGDELRHYPGHRHAGDREPAHPRHRRPTAASRVASALRALSNGDGSEVQLFGSAQVVREAPGRAGRDRVPQRVPACLPEHRAGALAPAGGGATRRQPSCAPSGMEYDNLARVVELKGRQRAVLPAACAARLSRERRMNRLHRWSSSPAPPAASARRWRRASARAGYRLALVARREAEVRAWAQCAGLQRRRAPASTPPTCATWRRSRPPAAPASPRRACPTW